MTRDDQQETTADVTARDWLTSCRPASEPADTVSQQQLVAVSTGEAWDVVQVPSTLGWETVRGLQSLGAPLGPVLHSPDGVAFFVATGSATEWDLPHTTVLHGKPLLAPPPSVKAPHTMNARTWINAPEGDSPRFTDADDLYGAYAAAVVAVEGVIA